MVCDDQALSFSPSGGDTSTKTRILAATAEVLSRNGQTKLSLSEVAQQARVSRPTIYRLFSSKEGLLAAFARYEHRNFDIGISRATAGLGDDEKLRAALRFMVDYQQSYSAVRIARVEPEYVIAELRRVIPVMRERLQRLLPGPQGAVAAGAAIRIAISHYLVSSDDADQFLAQLCHAVGIEQPPTTGRSKRPNKALSR
jgi:AcrR family transcriptional regulator